MQTLPRSLLVLLLPLAVECAANKGTVAWVSGGNNVPTVHAFSSVHANGPATSSIDGDTATFWNPGRPGWNVPNWIAYDFGAPQEVTGFSFTCLGDTVHDVKDWELGTSATGSGPWTVVASGVGVSGSSAPQAVSFAGTTARYWRFNVLTRYSQYQVVVAEVEFTAPSVNPIEITSVSAGASAVSTGQAWVNVPTWLEGAAVHTLLGVAQPSWTLRLECPSTPDQRVCQFTFLHYSCLPCGQSTNGGVPAVLIGEGFSGGGCGPRYVPSVGADTQNTVFWKKLLENGESVDVILTAELKHASVWDVSSGCAAAVTPSVHAFSAEHPSGLATSSIDGDLGTFWVDGHPVGWTGPNWIAYDFGAPQYVTGFSFTCIGDIMHDVKDWELGTSATGSGPWTVVASGVGVSGSFAPQVVSFAGTTARYWRFNVLTRHGKFQVLVTEVGFTGCPPSRCPQQQGPAQPSMCLPCLGA